MQVSKLRISESNLNIDDIVQDLVEPEQKNIKPAMVSL